MDEALPRRAGQWRANTVSAWQDQSRRTIRSNLSSAAWPPVENCCLTPTLALRYSSWPGCSVLTCYRVQPYSLLRSRTTVRPLHEFAIAEWASSYNCHV